MHLGGGFAPENPIVPLPNPDAPLVEVCYACIDMLRGECVHYPDRVETEICLQCGRAKLPAYRLGREAFDALRLTRQHRLRDLLEKR